MWPWPRMPSVSFAPTPPLCPERGKKGSPAGPEIVSHELWVDTRISGYGHGSQGDGGGWPGLRQVVCIRRRREPLSADRPVTVEDQYYLTSRRPGTRHGSPEALLA